MRHSLGKAGVIELFAGAGGLGVAARNAGAQVLLTIELDPVRVKLSGSTTSTTAARLSKRTSASSTARRSASKPI